MVQVVCHRSAHLGTPLPWVSQGGFLSAVSATEAGCSPLPLPQIRSHRDFCSPLPIGQPSPISTKSPLKGRSALQLTSVASCFSGLRHSMGATSAAGTCGRGQSGHCPFSWGAGRVFLSFSWPQCTRPLRPPSPSWTVQPNSVSPLLGGAAQSVLNG